MTIIISVHVVKPERGTIKFAKKDSLIISLKPGRKYFVQVVDTKYSLMPVNPKIVPGTKFKLSENSALYDVYFDVGDVIQARVRVSSEIFSLYFYEKGQSDCNQCFRFAFSLLRHDMEINALSLCLIFLSVDPKCPTEQS